MVKLVFYTLGGAALLGAADFYVSPTGQSSGNGSQSSPWSLTAALAHPSSVRPGDTIWLRAGTYRGAFESRLRGTSAAPIVVRAYRGERATIDGAPSQNAALTLRGEYTHYWGFEVTNTSPGRITNVSDYGFRPYGVTVVGPNIKLINLVIHDVSSAIGLWDTAVNAEAYGCIIYNNGYTDATRGHGQGIYAQNSTGTKRIIDNVIFNQFDSAMHIYGSSQAPINNFIYEGNIIFGNGSLTTRPNGRGFLIGGGLVANNHVLRDNLLYNTFNYSASNNMNIAYGRGSSNVTLQNNYSAGYAGINYEQNVSGLTATGNTFIGFASTNARAQISASTNTFLSGPPSTGRVFVRPNQYDSSKAFVVIYNWANQTSVPVNLSDFLAVGESYQIRKVENYHGSPVASGVFSSANVSFPMNNRDIASAVGTVPRQPVSSFPTFGVFEVVKVGSTTTTTPTPVESEPSAPAPAPTPAPSTGFLTSPEAESAQLTSPMFSPTDSSASGGRYVTSSSANTGMATFTFTAPANGQYAVWARVKAASHATDSLFVQIDWGPTQIFDVAENKWSTNWQWTRLNTRGPNGEVMGINPWNITLTKGNHTIRMRMREPNTFIDRIVVTNNLSYIPQ